MAVQNFQNRDQLYFVAFAENEVSGHTVLPVLACNELFMSHKAKIGNVLKDTDDLRKRLRDHEPDRTGFRSPAAAGSHRSKARRRA